MSSRVLIDEKRYWETRPFWSGVFMTSLSDDRDNHTEFTSLGQYVQASKARLFNDDTTFTEIMRSTDTRVHRASGMRIKGFEQAVWTYWKPRILQSAFVCQMDSPRAGHNRQWYQEWRETIHVR